MGLPKHDGIPNSWVVWLLEIPWVNLDDMGKKNMTSETSIWSTMGQKQKKTD